MNQNMLLKSKKKLVVLLIIYLSIGFAFIGLVFFMKFSNKDEEALELSELVLNNNVKEGQYVKLEIDTLPILIMSTSKKESQFYYVTDVSKNTYIVNLSSKTFKSIVETFNVENTKANFAYQLKGITNNINEQIKKVALSNSYKVFKNKELNLDNF